MEMESMQGYRGLLHRWFIQYNPLYFFSALCMLGGVFLVSPGLEVEDGAWQFWETVLTMVIEVYQIVLIIGAALLFRYIRLYRPSVILGLLALIFLFDVTFQTEVMGTFDGSGLFLTGNWMLLAVVKMIALSWAFQLIIPRRVLIIPLLAIAAIAFLPHLFTRTDYNHDTLHLLAVWWGIGLTTYIFYKRPVIRCKAPLTQEERENLQKITNAAWLIWAGFYLYHLVFWVDAFGVSLNHPSLYLIPGLLAFALLSKKEKHVWACCAGTLFICFFQLKFLSPAAFLICFIFGMQAWRLKQPRLYIGAVLAGYLAVQTIGCYDWPLPELNHPALLAAAAALIVIAYYFRLPLALAPLILGLYPIGASASKLSIKGWGLLLIAMAFVTLISGVAVNWFQKNGAKPSPSRNEKTATPNALDWKNERA